MKFVHIADMHFDTPFQQIKNCELGTIRRLEQRKVFEKIIDFIKEHEIDYFFIAGDFYEHKNIKESTIEFINNLFKQIPNTKVFITPGNHDPYIKNSFYDTYKWNNNVKIFNSKIEKIELEDCNIYGFGFDDFYFSEDELSNIILNDKTKPNILITHGTLNGTNNTDLQYNAISKSLLEQIGFDYVALGHIHKKNWGINEKIIYPGSTVCNGFDEPGEHGMVVGEIEQNILKTAFIELDETKFEKKEILVKNLNSIDDLIYEISTKIGENQNYYEIVLIGNRRFEIDTYNLKKLIHRKNIIKIKDETRIVYNFEALVNENTLRGIFVKKMIEKLENPQLDKKIVEQALEIGIEILEK